MHGAALKHVLGQTVAHLNVWKLFAQMSNVFVWTCDQKTNNSVFHTDQAFGFTDAFSVTGFYKHSCGLLRDAIYHDGLENEVERHKKESGIIRSLLCSCFREQDLPRCRG